MNTSAPISTNSLTGPAARWARWKIVAIVVSFCILRSFLVDRHNSAQVAFIEAYEAQDSREAWRSFDIAESSTWSWLPFAWTSKQAARVIITSEAHGARGVEAPSAIVTRFHLPPMPSWASRRKRWLGLGSIEWTLQAKTFLGGTKTAVYQISSGKAVEQAPGN